MKSRRALLSASWFMLTPVARNAWSATRLRVIGMLGSSPQSDGAPLFAAALNDLGWREGREVAFEYRGGEQPYERLLDFARDLVALHVDLIVVMAGVTAALAAKEATTTIPILAIGVADPVKFGLVTSLAHPGGNVTGLTGPLPEWGKYLELARDAVVGATRIAVLGNPTNVVYPSYVSENEMAARRLKVKLQMIPVAQADQLAGAFEATKRERAEVLVLGPDRVFARNMKEILERAQAQKLPVIGAMRPAAELGAVASYGLDGREMSRRAATYADKLLRGIKPGDLAIEQPKRFELVINLKAALALGITIPRPLLLRADQVIQ
jgi:putative ABC transport system substrate-binding protein